MSRSYTALVRFVGQQAWAVHLPVLLTIRELVEMHVRGEKFDAAEIEQRTGGRRTAAQQQTGGQVAVLPLWGVLVPHAGMMIDVSTPGNGLDAWGAAFDEAVNDPNVETILIQANSPGGSAEGVTEAAAKIRAARGRKQIVAVADGMAASAAYALVSQADTLLVTPSGQVGSVGVYSIHEDRSAALEANGVKPTVVQAPVDGFKTEGNPFGPLTDEARAHMQRSVDSYYAMFVSDVAKGRGISASTVEANYGRGRLLTAGDALAAGMVDGIATFEETLARLLSGKQLKGGARQEIEPPEPVALDPVGAAVAAASESFPGAASLTHATSTTVTTAAITQLAQIFPAASVAEKHTSSADSARVNDERSATTMDAVSTTERPPTLEELAAQQDAIDERLEALNAQAAGRMFTPDEQTEYDMLNAKYAEIGATMAQMKQRDDDTARRAKAKGAAALIPGDGSVTMEQAREAGTAFGSGITIGGAGRRALPDNLFDLHAYRRYAPSSYEQLAAKIRDGAMFANETTSYVTRDLAHVRGFVHSLLAADGEKNPSESFGTRCLVTMNPEYERQFADWLRLPDSGRPKMAVSIGGLGSETPIPITIDPTVLLDSDGATNPMRRISRVVSITGNTWRGIASDGVTFAYEGELAAVTAQTPDFRAPEVTVVKAQAEVQFAIEVDQDWGAFRGELARLFSDAKNSKEASVFLHGTGGNTNQPEGLMYALDVDNTAVYTTATANTVAVVDAEGMTTTLPPRFDDAAQWIANKAFYVKIRQLLASAGRIDTWVPFSQAGFPSDMGGALPYPMLGYPTNNASEVSKLFTTGGENVAVLGDFSRGFVIVDRVGMNVELDPLVRDGNGKLIGARALYIYFRNNSKLLSANAFQMLQVKAT